MPSPTRPPPQRFQPQRGLTLQERAVANLPAKPNGGRPMSPARISRMLAEREATAEDFEQAAKALGFESAAHAGVDLGEGASRQALILWMLQKMAIRGNQWAIQNLLDRWVPKPRRVELAGPGGGAIPLTAVPAAAAGAAGREAADYFASLDAPAHEGDADADAADARERERPTSGGYAGHEIIDVEALAADPAGEDLL